MTIMWNLPTEFYAPTAYYNTPAFGTLTMPNAPLFNFQQVTVPEFNFETTNNFKFNFSYDSSYRFKTTNNFKFNFSPNTNFNNNSASKVYKRSALVSGLTSNRALNAVKVAEAELAKGVKEDCRNNDSRDIRRYKKGAINNHQWCCYFASYCFGDGQGSSNSDTFGFDASTQSVKNKAIQAGCYAYKNSGYTPKKGDLAMWTKTASTGHIGIVAEVYPDGSFDVIEGNSGDAVKKHHYKSQSSVGSTFNGFVKMSEWTGSRESQVLYA